MMDQTWSYELRKRYVQWEERFHAWALTQPDGLIDLVTFLKMRTDKGMPSCSAAFSEARAINIFRLPKLKAAYELIDPCPAKL